MSCTVPTQLRAFAQSHCLHKASVDVVFNLCKHGDMSTSWLVIQTQDSIADSECVWSSEMVPSDKEYECHWCKYCRHRTESVPRSKMTFILTWKPYVKLDRCPDAVIHIHTCILITSPQNKNLRHYPHKQHTIFVSGHRFGTGYRFGPCRGNDALSYGVSM